MRMDPYTHQYLIGFLFGSDDTQTTGHHNRSPAHYEEIPGPFQTFRPRHQRESTDM